MRIDDWKIYEGKNHHCRDAKETRLSGLVQDHPSLPEGAYIVTTPIIGKDGEYVVARSGTRFHLGAINPSFAKLNPDAEKKLLDSLREVTYE